jgi:hypothetical protein
MFFTFWSQISLAKATNSYKDRDDFRTRLANLGPLDKLFGDLAGFCFVMDKIWLRERRLEPEPTLRVGVTRIGPAGTPFFRALPLGVAVHEFLCYLQYLIKAVIILYRSSKAGEWTAALGIYDMQVVRGHAHRARNDTSDYLCLLHDESSTFMRCTVELSFIIRWDDDSVFLGLSVWYSTDLQATCKKAGSNLRGTGEALQASQWFWETVDCSSTFGSFESPW